MRKNIVSPFIELIWDLVQDPNSDHIITWSPNGTSFCVTDQQKFTTEILARHFKHANMSSFVRQLNMYNFHKNKSNTKELQFFHKLFRRDAKQILTGIKRKPSQADHLQGEKLLQQYMCKKYDENRIRKQNEHFEQDKVSQNTGMDSFYRKEKLSCGSTDKQLSIGQAQHILLPRVVLNIILINRPDEI